MIFVTLGTQDIPFNRILVELDRLIEAGEIQEEVFAQTGYSTYTPAHFPSSRFIDMQQFQACIEKASVIISHGGAGSLVAGIKTGKRVIAVPRLKKYGEHVNDHQVELIGEFTAKGYILSVVEMSELKQALEDVKHFQPMPYVSGNARIIDILETFIGE